MVVLFIFCISCSRDSSKGELKRERVNAVPVIGFAMDTLVVDRWRKDLESVLDVFGDLGFQVLVRDGRNSSELQKRQVEELVDSGIDLLLIIPHDSDTAAEIIIPAQKRGIPVVCYDRMINRGSVDAYVSFDNESVGRIQMEGLLSLVPEGRYMIINGSPRDSNSTALRKGAALFLDKVLAKGNVSVEFEIWAEDWSSDFAYSRVSEFYDKNGSVDAIWAANDSLAGTAIRVLAENKQAGNVAIGGQDADLDACQRIVEGTQSFTIYKPIASLAETAGMVCASLLLRNTLPETEDLVFDGTSNVPFFKVPVVRVTKENMEDIIIASGFHRREQVYQNLRDDHP